MSQTIPATRPAVGPMPQTATKHSHLMNKRTRKQIDSLTFTDIFIADYTTQFIAQRQDKKKAIEHSSTVVPQNQTYQS